MVLVVSSLRIKGLWCPPGVPLRSFPTGGRLRACGVHPVSWNFFSLEDLHEVFSPRSTRYNPRAGPAFPPFHYFEFKFNIWKARTPIAAHSRTFFFTRRSFFPRSAEDLRKPRPLRAWFSPPAPTAPPDQLRCPMHGSCNLLSPRQVRLLVFVRS